jgi:hypothetical protein
MRANNLKRMERLSADKGETTCTSLRIPAFKKIGDT